MKTALMCNFTMDGAISELLMERIYPVMNGGYRRCGYTKFQEYYQTGKLFHNDNDEKYEKLIIMSMSVPINIYQGLSDHYGPNLSIVDYHPETEKLLNLNTESKIIWDAKISSAKSILNAINRVGKVNVEPFAILANLADVFELWRTDDNMWDAAYAMNALFWHYSYFKFIDRHKSGVTKSNPLIDDIEKNILKNIFKKKHESMAAAIKEEVSDTSVLFLNADVDVVSDFSLNKNFSQYTLFYIVYRNQRGQHTIAIRSKDPNHNVNDTIKVVAGRRTENDITGGGFGQTGSVTITKFVNANQILDIVEQLDNAFLGIFTAPSPTSNPYDDDDIPFRFNG